MAIKIAEGTCCKIEERKFVLAKVTDEMWRKMKTELNESHYYWRITFLTDVSHFWLTYHIIECCITKIHPHARKGSREDCVQATSPRFHAGESPRVAEKSVDESAPLQSASLLLVDEQSRVISFLCKSRGVTLNAVALLSNFYKEISDPIWRRPLLRS